MYLKHFSHILLLLFASANMSWGQIAYQGPHAQRYAEKAYEKIRHFYSNCVDAFQDKEIQVGLIEGIIRQDIYPANQCFMPDFARLPDDGAYSFQHYISKFISHYAARDQETFSFQPTDFQLVSIQHTENNSGVRLLLAYHNHLLIADREVWNCKVQAVVVFPDMTQFLDCKIGQIVPMTEGDITVTLTATDWLRKGKEAERDSAYAEAFGYYRKAAELGDAEGEYKVGIYYLKGMRKSNQTKCLMRYNYDDCTHISYTYYCCEATKNIEEAVKWFRLSAEQGNANGQNALGFSYQYGEGVEENMEEAIKWYWLATEQKNARAQYNLGFCYFIGKGVEKDLKEAIRLIRMSADQGYSMGQAWLGFCYEIGIGVGKDEKAAARLYRLSADQGCLFAQFRLGLCYEYGKGIPIDKQQATKWIMRSKRISQDIKETIDIGLPDGHVFLDNKDTQLRR